MDSIRLSGYAKINLLLDIVGKRPDGYHFIKSVMQNLKLCDYITVQKASADIKIITDHPYLPLGKENIAYKAAELFLKRTGIKSGVIIKIEKNIPVAAGLAGGSSNAAAVLRGLNIIFEKGLTPYQLALLGEELGADVPFCVIGGTVLAEGIGEKLTLLPPLPCQHIVLVKPNFGVSTAAVYKNYNFIEAQQNNTIKALTSLKKGDFESSLRYLENVLEKVTFKMHPEVEYIKKMMFDLGSKASLMCGSGPTVFGIAKDEDHAKELVRFFKNKYQEVLYTTTL